MLNFKLDRTLLILAKCYMSDLLAPISLLFVFESANASGEPLYRNKLISCIDGRYAVWHPDQRQYDIVPLSLDSLVAAVESMV